MKTQVTFRHVNGHHPNLQELAMEEAGSFEKYYEGITSTHVEFSNETVKIVTFTVHINGNVFVSKDESDDFKKSLKAASEKMIRQLTKQKEKVTSHRPKAI